MCRSLAQSASQAASATPLDHAPFPLNHAVAAEASNHLLGNVRHLREQLEREGFLLLRGFHPRDEVSWTLLVCPDSAMPDHVVCVNTCTTMS